MLPTAILTGGSSSFSFSQFWDALRAKAAARATVDVQEDFGSGLGSWKGGASTWTPDPSGFVNIGKLAVHEQTFGLTDYRFEFTGQIQQKSLTFVFRAKDLDNYYAVRLAITNPGPLPKAKVSHYAVLGGAQGKFSPEVSVNQPLRADTIYRVHLSAYGQDFVLRINDEVVDTWSDARLKSGGVGFLSEKGSAARLKSVRVVDQDDFLGKVCYQFSQQTADRKVPGEKND